MFFLSLPCKRTLFLFLNFVTKITLPLSSHLLPFCKGSHHGTTLLQGQAKDKVYEWSVFPSHSSSIIAFFSTKSSPNVWHYRLGHPSSSIYKHIVSTFGLEFSKSSNFNFNCNSYQCNKSHKLPFSTSSLVSHFL